jgi:aspartate/methionine/tyrosine aminotransferase
MRLNPFVCETDFPPVPEAASWIAGREFSADKPLIDVSQAVPGYDTSTEIIEHIASVLSDRSISVYGPVTGMTSLRECYADSFARDTTQPITASNVAITAGCNQAFYVAIAALCAPGDEVILPAPWYFNHKMSLDMLGARAVPLPCVAEEQMLPDTERAAALINAKTKALVLISPNNPTGLIYPPETIDRFYQLCREKNIALIIDETYRDFRDQPELPPHHIFNDPDWPETAIHLYSFSKAFALAGYRVGALVASDKVMHEVTKILDCITICATQISQQAALCGLQRGAAWKEEKRQLMRQRAAAFSDAITGHTNHYEITAQGPYFAYLRHPFSGVSSRAVAQDLARNANILSIPGDMFGPGQQQYLRFAFANVGAELMPTIATRLANHQVDSSKC